MVGALDYIHISITNTLPGASAMNNMKQLEYLMRLHVMIATMHNDGDEKCLQSFLSSLSYVMLMWKVLLYTTHVYLIIIIFIYRISIPS